MFHEAHHLVHQQGWAAVWPEIFGDIACSCDNLKACDDTPGACAGDDDDDDDDWPTVWDKSLVCKEVALHQCVKPGWAHRENKCPCDDHERKPGDPAPSPLHGTCNADNCDCVEFHRTAGLTYAGQYDPDTCFYDSSQVDKGSMPTTKATISEMLSDEYKAILDDPKYAQPRKPLSDIYKPSSTPAAASFAAADGGVASSWALTLVAAVAFGLFALKLYSKADGAEAGPLLAKAT